MEYSVQELNWHIALNYRCTYANYMYERTLHGFMKDPPVASLADSTHESCGEGPRTIIVIICMQINFSCESKTRTLKASIDLFIIAVFAQCSDCP